MRPSSDRPGSLRWPLILLAAAAVFAGSAVVVFVAGVPRLERDVYAAVTGAVPSLAAFQWITRLGTAAALAPVTVLLVALLPRPFLRRWWLWVVVMVVVTTLEGLGKLGLGRPRPGGMRPGFPSGHTAAAAAFFGMACYFFEGAVSRPVRRALYALAAVLVLAVALSRMMLHVHWPLDVVGGAALGVAVLAVAAWCHERFPLDGTGAWIVPPALGAWVYRWQNALSLGLVAVLFVTPPMAEEPLDLVFDCSGALFVVAGLLLRLWISGHAPSRGVLVVRLPERLVTTGPHAVMRHPRLLANLLTAVGVVLLAESGPGLVVIPAALVAMYRLTLPIEDAAFRERFGAAYLAYRERVPSLPRLDRASLAALRSGLRELGMTSWGSLARALPAIATSAALATLAELSESMPHLLR
jgi:membrane-associated phospholipid phosphatase